MGSDTQRVAWSCPKCGKRYRIRAGHNPDQCPECLRQATYRTSPTPDPPEWYKNRTTGERTFVEQSQKPEPPAKEPPAKEPYAPSIEIEAGDEAFIGGRSHSVMNRGSHLPFSHAIDLLVDLRIKRYLTPWLIRGLWKVWVFIGVLAIGLSVVDVFVVALGIGADAQQANQGGGGFQPRLLLKWLSGLRATPTGEAATDCVVTTLLTILMLIAVRISYEAVIVVFNMAEDMRAVRNREQESSV